MSWFGDMCTGKQKLIFAWILHEFPVFPADIVREQYLWGISALSLSSKNMLYFEMLFAQSIDQEEMKTLGGKLSMTCG